jgi:hypothetical protein
MGVILEALADLDGAAPEVTAVLARELGGWAERSSADEPPLEPGVLLVGLLAWTRLHGIISLEIEGVFDQMKIDPARLYNAEIDHLIAQRQGTCPTAAQR